MDPEKNGWDWPVDGDTYIVQKKVSPFADSPYESVYTQAPVQQVRRRKRKTGKIWKQIIALTLAVVILCTACVVTAAVVRSEYQLQLSGLQASMEEKISKLRKELDQMQNTQSQPQQGGTVQLQPGEQLTPGQVYSQNAQAVVAVMAEISAVDMFGQTSTGLSTGTGFLISSDGYIVTNYHVIADSKKQSVMLFSGEEYAATIVGSDRKNDIALLKIEGKNFPWVSFGSSGALAVGDQVVAIGHPLGSDEATLTVGYVSAKDVVVTGDSGAIYMLQTDAAINSGNSGGPLFNMRGEVVGITTSKYSGYSSSGASIEGMGFALPSDDVSPMLADLAKYGYVTGAYLGVYVRNAYAQSADLPDGAYVEEAMAGFSAEKAGILSGDVIVAVDDVEIDSVVSLTRALRKYSAGDTIKVRVWRQAGYQDITVVLDPKPQEDPPLQSETEPTAPPEVQPTVPEEKNQEGEWDWFNYLPPFFNWD